jgi:hypothetical protein
MEFGSICLPGAVGDLANFSFSGGITLKDYGQAGTENDEVSRPCWHRLEPGPNVFAEDVVLDDRGKSRLAVFGCYECREAIAKIEKPPGLNLITVPWMDPATHRRSVELTSSHVSTPLELTSE